MKIIAEAVAVLDQYGLGNAEWCGVDCGRMCSKGNFSE